jgi:molybdopterin-guanine dinucleotide biosynthesis protein B
MIALGLAGWSGAGKTTLAAALIGIFTRGGLAVSSIKHAHHDLVFDRPGKDSYRHAEAGAREVILAANGGFALFSRAVAPGPVELLSRLAPVDLVLIEGFRDYAVPKLEVYRPALGKPPLWTSMKMLAVASDGVVEGCPVPVLDLNDPAGIADFLAGALGLESYARAEE